ncbi:c-type cytochrome domain-containing protein [Sideroxydans lithotrophicus]|uniref:Transmembrane region and signal peptide prediction n=1 Tax=Sideroxydans lithotrophicus (strain ES-1) TaxID=580332 RepID=D5CMP7_SIDLE|nr:c-type cytochrome domain-containing protein [Sideroxydans lithotrophicus]ADE12719.1 transmembrane region and signal peptide prediction [Sideroxydans lithotrophicus ES-1]
MKNQTLLKGIVVAVSLYGMAFTPMAFADVSFKSQVKPIIHDYCLSCHQPGGQGYEKSGLDMRSYKSLMKGTKFGSIIKPGDSFSSIMIQLVEGRAHASIKMPFGTGGLAKDKVDVLKTWVDQGAKNN